MDMIWYKYFGGKDLQFSGIFVGFDMIIDENIGFLVAKQLILPEFRTFE